MDGTINMLAALFVEADGAYANLQGVDVWDEARDARSYPGPWPVVAHPPCQRWGKLWAGQPLHIALTGERQVKGSDDGCFAAALEAVRTYGGVLEHPWGSHAWPHFGLEIPSKKGGWIRADNFGGFTCCVDQVYYGHYASKLTLLYAAKVRLPMLYWGKAPTFVDPELARRIGLKAAKRRGEVASKGGGRDSETRIGTPEPFRNMLLSIAMSATQS